MSAGARVWYLHTAEGQAGPYTADEIRAWRSAGSIADDRHVWREGLPSWRTIGETPELAAFVPDIPAAPAVPVAAVAAPAAAQPAAALDPAFRRDKFLLRQKHLSISEKYTVWDEAGRAILFIERPAHLLRNLGALVAGIAAGVLVGVVLAIVGSLVPYEPVQVVFYLLAVLGGIVTLVAVGVALSAKRHVTFYRDEGKREALLEVLQDSKFQVIVATYTVRDPAGTVLALLRKNHLYNLFRKRWDCLRPDGRTICVAKEDSIILSLLRRFLGPLFGLLRTNFLLFDAREDAVVGEFNRKFTLLDRYVLDMSADRTGAVDRRVAVALGVMLDTGERR